MRIVEELFPGTPCSSWDLLLELRGGLLEGKDWDHTLEVFLACRERLEDGHYLPFYRLRRLLTASLRFEAGGGPGTLVPLRQVLARKHRSLDAIKRAVSRELFEHDLTASADHPVVLRVVER